MGATARQTYLTGENCREKEKSRDLELVQFLIKIHVF